MGWVGTMGWAHGAFRGLRAAQESDEPAEQIEWVQQVRDLGPLVWLVALAAAAVWFLVLGLAAAKVRPRRVTAGPDLLDPPGDESPALVNLVTNSWNLEHEAVSATLLDLAARDHVSIHDVSDGSVSVHVPSEARADEGQLAPYERQVLEHVRKLASATPARVVPGAALTTGAGSKARGWWSRFKGSVVRDARDRGLARRRWPRSMYLVLFLLGAPAAVPWGVALATEVYADQGTDADLVTGVVVYSIVGLMAPAGVLGFIAIRRQVADTEAGREVAARWLGLRSGLSWNSMLTESDAAGVTMWGRKLAYGAALGLAHGAATSVPLGAENKRELWSTTSGTWRVVRVHYSWPGTYGGRHPLTAIVVGLLSMGVLFLPYKLLQLEIFEPGLAALPLLTFLLIGLWGAFTVLRGLADALTGRRTVAGEVLRVDEVGTSKNPSWHVVVDDGVSDELYAWRVFKRPRVGDGARVQGDVSRWLRHVRKPQILTYADGSIPAANDERDFLAKGLTSSTTLLNRAAGGSVHMDIGLALNRHANGSGPGTLPDAEALSRAVGRDVRTDDQFMSDSLVTADQAVGFRLGAGTLQIARLTEDGYRTFTRLKILHREVEGVGVEAIRLKASGTLLARQGQDAVMVVVNVPSEPRREIEQIQLAAAQTALAAITSLGPASGVQQPW